MSEMIKRAARAAHGARIFVINSDKPDEVIYEETSPRNHHLYEKLARAVIESMREPTEAMVKANHTQPISGGVEDGWRAMIDEALK